MDIGLLYICFATVTHSILTQKLPWKNAFNFLTMGALVWALFCFFQLLNPTAISEAWMSSRNIIYSGLVVSFIASVLVTQYKHVKQLLFLLSILVLLACIKAFMQKYIGFDGSEKQWLAEGGARTHIIATGTRYFSFFTDAGNFGSNMGFASVVFGISAIYTSNKNMRIYYIIIAPSALKFQHYQSIRKRITAVVHIRGIAEHSAVKRFSSPAVDKSDIAVFVNYLCKSLIRKAPCKAVLRLCYKLAAPLS